MKEHIHFLVLVFRAGCFVKGWGETYIAKDNAHLKIAVICAPLENDSNTSLHYI